MEYGFYKPCDSMMDSRYNQELTYNKESRYNHNKAEHNRTMCLVYGI